jgi:putative metallohydrolase (TIGR04338 family)
MSRVVVRFQPGLKPTLLKHETHDQSSHGSWARGGNRLGTEDIMALHFKGDSQQQKVYASEGEIFKEKRPNLPAPEFNKTRADFTIEGAYEKAYKEYSKKWDAWARNEAKDIQSDLGKKHLDGTPSGVQKYVNAVLETDYWKETFGYSPIGTPKVKATNSVNHQGKWEVGRKFSVAKGWEYMNNLSIKRTFTMNEPTILHELAHFGTAITQTSPFESHGKEFTRNYIDITTNIAGADAGNRLRVAYQKGGVEVAD